VNIPVKSVVISAFMTLAVGLYLPAFAQNSNARSASTAASLAGSSWTIVESNGDKDIFNFLADGTLSYSYQNGSYTNGTWKQDVDSIYIEMNNKFVEYNGRISGTHIEGIVSNVKGKTWTWTADMKSQTPTTPTP
jgi:osmotically-inducible protein OsmY